MKKRVETEKKSAPKKANNSRAVLDSVVADINSKYGDGAIQIGIPNKKILRVPTGLISLDIDLGGGIPVGRATNIAGGFSVAKTTLALHILKAFQKAGYKCSFFDIEGTSGTEEYLNGIGVDVENLLYANPSSLEETCNMILDIQKGGVFNFALWDCIIVTKPNKVVEKEVGDSVQMGVMQVILDEFFSKFMMNNNKLVREGKTPFTLITVNQLREKPTMYGNPEYAPGGRAKDFAFSIDIRLRRAEWIVEGKGASKSIVTESVAFGLIEQGGAWYVLDTERGLKFQGFNKLVDYLRENPKEVDSLQKRLLELTSNG